MNTTKTTKQDLIEAINFDIMSEDQAIQIVMARFNTLHDGDPVNAGTQVIHELLVATSKHSSSASPLFAKIAVYCYHAGWKWDDFHQDMKKAYLTFWKEKGKELTSKEISSHSGKWAGFKKREDLWNVIGKSQSQDDELTNILKSLRRVKAKLEEIQLNEGESFKIKSSLDDIQSLITIG